MTPRAGLDAAFALGRQVSPYLAHSRPVRWAAVHFSELARNRRGGDLRRAWQEVLWPAMGVFGVLARAGVPVGIVDDYHLEHDRLEGYQVLYLPNPNELSSAQKETLRRFVGRGGIVQHAHGLAWSDPQASATAARAFLRFHLQPVIDCLPPPVQVSSSAARMHAVAFEDPNRRRLMIAITNDFSWVQWVTGREVPDPVNARPDSISAVVQVKNRRPPVSLIEVVHSTTPIKSSIPQGYRVRLPAFVTMALLAVHE
jgi:hypothetical protein